MSENEMILGVSKFYSNKNKRKWIGLERSVNEVVKKHKEERLPTVFPSRILGPSTSWKIFFRQKDAFQFSRSKAKDLHVFAFESESYETNTGQRMYLVASYPVFWHYYSQLEEQNRHHYEVIPEGAVCKLYFDLEFNIPMNPLSDGNKMVELLIQFVCQALELEFGLKCLKKDILDLDASTKDKFSRHLIFQLKQAVFKDNIHAGTFISYIMSQLLLYWQSKSADVTIETDKTKKHLLTSHESKSKPDETEQHLLTGNEPKSKPDESEQPLLTGNEPKSKPDETTVCNQDTSDIKETSANGNVSTGIDSLSETNENPDANSKSDTVPGNTNNTSRHEDIDERYRNLLQSFTPEELGSFLVKNKNGETVLFCDLGVYTKNRNFRLYLSSKLKKNNPLVLSTENSCVVSEKQEDFFLCSLVSNTRFTTSTKVLTFEKESDSFVNYTRKRSEKMKGKETLEGYSMSPYPEVDGHITSLVTENGNRGAIRHWTYFHQGELLLYEISRYRFCHNIGRQHRSNNIMYVVDLHKGIFYQKCHDPDCYAQNYKSPEWQLPPDVLPDSYFTDIEDEFELEMDDQELLDSTLQLEQSILNKSTGVEELEDGDDEDLMSAAELMEHSTHNS